MKMKFFVRWNNNLEQTDLDCLQGAKEIYGYFDDDKGERHYRYSMVFFSDDYDPLNKKEIDKK